MNKLLQKTPFFNVKHNQVLCKGLNFDAQNSAMQGARKRFEQKLLNDKQRDTEEEKLLKQLDDENQRYESA